MCHRFIPSPARALVRSNLCLSLSLLVWFVGSRLGTVITEYPPLTSGTLVVLSPPLAHLLPPKTRRGPTRDDDGRCAARSKWDQPTIASRSSSSCFSSSFSSFTFSPAPSFLVTLSSPSCSCLYPLSHHRACSPFLFFSSFSIFPLLSRFIHSACPLLSPVPSSFFLSFRCRSFQAVFLLHSLPVLLSLSPSLFLALLLSLTNYLCLISDTVDAKR